MDNLCHTLVGAAFGEAGLKRRTRFGNVTLMIAANLPDIDVLVFATPVPAVSFRRGWTHGPLADLLLPVALTTIMLAIGRLGLAEAATRRFEPAGCFCCRTLACSHTSCSTCSTRPGLRVLAPFDWRWFYVDALYIIDPWLWLVLGAGVWLAARRTQPVFARGALLLAMVYIVAMVIGVRAARGIVLETWKAAHARPPVSIMVGPVPITPFHRDVVIDAGDHYETGAFGWFPARVVLNPGTVPKNDRDPLVAVACEAPRIRGFLVWSRFPFWTFEQVPGGTLATISDMRFPSRFSESVTIPSGGATVR